jgi:Guanosine polyphosphate pyrophosphohydrolases/synthetases
VGRFSFADVYDVFAFRVLVNNGEDCYKALGANT